MRNVLITCLFFIICSGYSCTSYMSNKATLDNYRSIQICLETSTKNVRTAEANIITQFECESLKFDPVRARPLYDSVVNLKKYLFHLNEFIDEAKMTLTRQGGGQDINGCVIAKGDVNVSSVVMIKQGRAKELKKRLDEAFNKIIKTCDPMFSYYERDNFIAREKETFYSGWSEDYFGKGTPLIAAVTTLTKMQADIANVELDITKWMLCEGSHELIIERYEPVASAQSSYIAVGQKYNADISLMQRYNDDPEMWVNGKKILVVGGRGTYEAVGTSEGVKKWTGEIHVKDYYGTIRAYRIPEQTYTVVAAAAH